MIYLYRCNQCKHEFEKNVPFHQKRKPRVRCPHCKGTVRKIISYPTPIIFKGDGFTKARKES